MSADSEKFLKFSSNREYIRNIGIVAHIDHGKTTFSDSLLAAGGMMSTELMGSKRLFDSDEQEQARGITIKSANATIYYTPTKSENEHCISIIDTPGHIDFNSEVIRALRVIDGAFLVVCASDKMKPQTETVLKQCLQEGVRPILFINKVDRLITQAQLDFSSSDKEKLTLESRIKEIIDDVNSFIVDITGDAKHPWRVGFGSNTVMLGSAYQRWGITLDYMKKSNGSLREIYDLVKAGNEEQAYKKYPLPQVALDCVCNVFPTPVSNVWKERLTKIWKNISQDSPIYQSVLNSVIEGVPASVFVTKVLKDPHLGFIYFLRVLSGKITRNQTLYISGGRQDLLINKEKIQRLYIFKGTEKIEIQEASAGQIVAVTGFNNVQGGDTLSDSEEMVPLSELMIMKPVISYSIMPKEQEAMVKFLNALFEIRKADSSFHYHRDPSTGEYIISGVGELHLENKLYEIENNFRIPYNLGPPNILYKERVATKSESYWGKSPRRHNRFSVSVKPMPEELSALLNNYNFNLSTFKRNRALVDEFVQAGLPYDQARRIMFVKGTCMLIDVTKGAQFMNEIMESLTTVFENISSGSLFTKEETCDTIIYLHDTVVHPTKEHRTGAEIIPAFFRGYAQAICTSGIELLEPFQKVEVECDSSFVKPLTGLIDKNEGEILEIDQSSKWTSIVFLAPVSRMLGFSKEARDACRGRVSWNISFDSFRPIPSYRLEEVITSIREKKGMPTALPQFSDFEDR